MKIEWHETADKEYGDVPGRERAAAQNALRKLELYGDTLPFPHSSHVEGPIRELRPRSGRSRIRLLYSRVGDAMWVLAVGPEATVDGAGFKGAVSAARQRLEEIR